MWDVVVIGGGIAGLTTAYELRKQAAAGGRQLRVCLVEGAPRLGGKILSDRDGGFLVEGGADSFITAKPWALELVRELGLEDHLVAANEAERTTYVLTGGRLVALPEGLQLLVPQRWAPFLRSPLLSWGAKLRVARERWVPPRRAEGDESVADFVRRRLGSEVLERLAEPLLAHIYVADVERMSLRATYPRLAEVVERHGSLLKAVRAVRRKGKTGAPPPVFLTLSGGLGEIVERLAEHLPPESRRLGHAVRGLEASGDAGYAVHLDDGTALAARAVVLAVPAFAAAELADPLDGEGLGGELARRLRAVRYVSLATLSLGYRRRDVEHPLAGYGFFVPRREQRTVLACTWTSSKFEGRASAEHVLLRVFLGGALQQDLLEHDDATLVRRVRDDLRDILDLGAEPVLERLYRWPRGYPQYEVGHLERVRAIEAALPPRLAVAGSAYHGVGLPDCIQSARQAARRVLHSLEMRPADVDGGAVAC